MADFDWFATCSTVHGVGASTAVMAGDTAGNIYSSAPLADDGNYSFWAFGDPYKATVTKNDGTEAEADVYEAYNLGLLVSGKKGEIPDGVGVRVNGEKYMFVKTLPAEKVMAKITDAEGNESTMPVTVEATHILQKGPTALTIAVKGGYFFAIKGDKANPAHSAPAALAAAAVGFYWAVGPDAA